MTSNDFVEELKEARNISGKEMELERLKTCYLYASSADRRVIWAVLDKYVPMLTAEGVI